MSTSDDDIAFDFFDEPDTEQVTQRRRLPRLERSRERPPRPPGGPPPGLTPLLRLVGLVALMIFIVVLLVFWVRSCQGASKRADYEHYMQQVTVIARESHHLGQEYANKVATPGGKTSQLSATVRNYAQQAQGQAADAQGLQPPGPLRATHQRLVDTLVLRASGLARFADALDQTATTRDASQAASKLVAQGQLLAASDIDWSFFFYDPAVQTLKNQGITGVAVPRSQFLSNAEIVGPDSMVRLFQQLHGAATGGTPSGKHGDGLVSVKALPAGTVLSTTQPTTIKSSTELAFAVTVENSGDSQEVGVPVTLTIQATSPIVKRTKIDLISPGQQKTVTFRNFTQLPFGPEVKIKVEVAPVPGEVNLSNNSATYPVFFSL